MSCFFLFWEGDLEQIRLQEGETDGVRWVALSPDLWEDETLADPVRKRLLLFWRDLVALSDRSQFSPWLGWAQELQSLAQQGLAYTKDPYDRERFVRLSEIAVEMLQEKSGCTKERIAGLFANETGYQTPKLEVRAAVFRDGKILLVQERGNRRWSLPGGWCDIGLGIGANAAKECREEAGVIVHPQRLIALENRAEHDYTPYVHHIIKCYVLCEEDAAGVFVPNTETLDARFFSEDDLPPLALDRVTPRSLQMCFAAARDENRPIYFD